MALVSVIRRWYLRDGLPIREIARRTGLSRNTVRKYLASQNLEPMYPSRKSPSKLDEYEETLTNWLFRESRRHPRRDHVPDGLEFHGVELVEQRLQERGEHSRAADFHFDANSGAAIGVMVPVPFVNVLVDDEVSRHQCPVDFVAWRRTPAAAHGVVLARMAHHEIRS